MVKKFPVIILLLQLVHSALVPPPDELLFTFMITRHGATLQKKLSGLGNR